MLAPAVAHLHGGSRLEKGTQKLMRGWKRFDCLTLAPAPTASPYLLLRKQTSVQPPDNGSNLLIARFHDFFFINTIKPKKMY